jgi:hypothetical protein
MVALGGGGCGFSAAGRGFKAAVLPNLLDGKSGGDYPDTKALPVIEIDGETWNDVLKNGSSTTLCQRGTPPPDALLKAFQDLLGEAEMYKSAADTQIKSLPFSSGPSVDSVSLECSSDKVVLGINGEAIGADWIAAFVGEFERLVKERDPNTGEKRIANQEDRHIRFHMLAVSHASGDALWLHLLYDRQSGKFTGRNTQAMNIKPYLVPSYSKLYTFVHAHVGEFFLVEKGKKGEGLYLFQDGGGYPRVARFKVASGS